jgi:Flp pilus assembly secretin CpaC
MRAPAVFALALAMPLAVVGAAPVFADSLVVPIDHSTRLSVRGQAASVVIGNPQVADVTVIDTHTVFISGRGYGETDVVVLDHAGRTLYQGEVIVAAPESGRVSVYRGAARTDLACAPACAVSTRSPTGGSEKGATPGSSGGMSGAAAASQPASPPAS